MTQARPGLAPGRYFRLLLIGYFEGLTVISRSSISKPWVSGATFPNPIAGDASGFNLGLLMRQLIGAATQRGLQGRLRAVMAALLTLTGSLRELGTRHGRSLR